MYVVTVQHYGQWELEIKSPLAIAYAIWTEEEDWCPLCQAHPSSGHTGACALVQQELNGRSIQELPMIPEAHD